MNQPSDRQLITKGIRDVIIPYFKDLGFLFEASRHLMILGDSKSLYPLGCLTRFSSDGSLDKIEFKFGKYKNSGFEINFAQIPQSGAHWDFGFSPQSGTSAYGFGNFGVCQKSRFFAFRNFCSPILKFSAFQALSR